jgi:Ca2+-binding RTX toxin-like protein
LFAGLFALVLIATLVTSFTAANVVPLSRAGRSVQPRTIAQLSPSQCAAVAATTLVIASGSSTSGTSGNDLILGRNAKLSLTLNGNGGTDCIIGGGGVGTINTFDGSSGADVCIGAVGAVNIFKNCEIHYN